MTINAEIRDNLVQKSIQTVDDCMKKNFSSPSQEIQNGRESRDVRQFQNPNFIGAKIPSPRDLDISSEVYSLMSLTPRNRLQTCLDAINELIQQKKFFAAFLLISELNDIIVVSREDIKLQSSTSNSTKNSNNFNQPQIEPDPPHINSPYLIWNGRPRKKFNVIFFDPAKIYTSHEDARIVLENFARPLGLNVRDLLPEDNLDSKISALFSPIGVIPMLLEAPVLQNYNDTPVFNRIVIGSYPTGEGGFVFEEPSINYGEKHLQPPSVSLTNPSNPAESQIFNFPLYTIGTGEYNNVAGDPSRRFPSMSLHEFEPGIIFGLFAHPDLPFSFALPATIDVIRP